MRKSGYGIIGLGRFGMALAKVLSEAGADVIVIDKDEDKLREVRDYVQETFLTGKLTKEALEACGIGECETVIVCIGQKVDVSVLTTLNVLNLGVKRVIAKADSNDHGIILERIGAEVVYPESETATRLAAVLMGSKAMDIMSLNGDYIISEIKVTKKLYGKKLTDLNLEKYDLKLVALEYEPDKTIIDFEPDEVLEQEDAIVVAGKFSDVERFERKVVNG
ncbi:MAG: TrkA family potassium uptake protein [Firmicutes bacterium]|nr:TrkA family potassium uptake protein [Bacillota bacterium]